MADEKSLKLGIKDRLTIPVLFPEKSNYVNQILAEDIGKKIRIGQEEMATINFRTTEPDKDGRSHYTWEGGKEIDKEIALSQAEIDFLKKRIDILDRDEEISPDILPLVKAIKAL